MALTDCRKSRLCGRLSLCLFFDRSQLPRRKPLLAGRSMSRTFPTTVFSCLSSFLATAQCRSLLMLNHASGRASLKRLFVFCNSWVGCGLDGVEASFELDRWELDGLLNFMSRRSPFSTARPRGLFTSTSLASSGTKHSERGVSLSVAATASKSSTLLGKVPHAKVAKRYCFLIAGIF